MGPAVLTPPGPTIHPARGEAALREAVRLFRAYAAGLGLDLGYQGFAAELAALPGAYAPPGGELLLARAPGCGPPGREPDGPALGCVAVRPLPASMPGSGPGLRACEMKRLFVAPDGRGLGLGRRLALAALEAGTRLGYDAMRLDTLERLAPALALYRSLGFCEVAPFHDDRVPGLLFLGRSLPPPMQAAPAPAKAPPASRPP